MNRPLPPRKLRRIANILARDADCLEESHTVAMDDGARAWSDDPPDRDARRQVLELRRLANELREAAG